MPAPRLALAALLASAALAGSAAAQDTLDLRTGGALPPPRDTVVVPAGGEPLPRDSAGRAETPVRGPGLGTRILREIPKVVRPRSSAGPVVVPELRGGSRDAARTALERLGLALGAVDELPVEGRPEGTVVLQRPAAGTSVRPGTVVSVMVAAAPALAAAPVEAPVAVPPPDPPARQDPVPSGRAVPPPQARPVEPPPPAREAPPTGAAPSPNAVADEAPPPEPGPAAEAAPGPVAEETRQPAPALDVPVAAPGEERAPGSGLGVLLLLLLLATAALAARRLRTRPAPGLLRARTRPGAEPRVRVEGTPFAGPALRLRTRGGVPAVTASTSTHHASDD